MVARWRKPDFKIVRVWPFGLEGLWLRYATLQNWIPSFPWIAPPRPPPWRNPRKGRDQILPSGSLSDAMAMGISGKVPGKKHPPPLQTHWEIQLPALVVLIRPRRADTTNDQPLSLLYPLPPRKKAKIGNPNDGPAASTQKNFI